MPKPVTLDCRDLACPGPVLRCIDALEKGAPESLEVRLSDPAAAENVTRLLAGKGYAVTPVPGPEGIVLQAARTAAAVSASESTSVSANDSASTAPETPRKILAFLTAEGIGSGSEELAGRLMLAFLGTLPELGGELWRIVLVNGGVRLACAGHPALEKLQALAASGVSILVCGTCLGYFDLLEQKRVGETTNMLDVVTSLSLADKILQA